MLLKRRRIRQQRRACRGMDYDPAVRTIASSVKAESCALFAPR